MKINGKWYFNSSLTFDDFEITGNRMQEDVSFTSVDRSIEGDVQSTSCTNMIFEYTMYYEVYYGIDDGSAYCVYSDGYWLIDEARTIDFGAAYQEVSDDFYAWLIANAIPLNQVIPMAHPKGIRLLTKGKKGTEDIEVVPTFMENVEITINNLYPNLKGSFSIEYSVYENNELKHIIVDHINDESVTIKVAKNSFFVIYSPTASINPYLLCYDDSVALFQTVHNDYGEGVGEILCGGFVKNSGVVYFEDP